MVDPNVLNYVGYSKEYQGFAWGVGIERLAMLKYQIDHIKNFYDNDLRFPGAILMKILKSWLNDWIDVENISSDDISEALESLGFEIESMTVKIPNYKNIIVGKVLEIYDHPDADKIRVTKVDVGSKIYEIVCGAWNFDVGAVVPVALPKSEIKDGFKIDKRDIRGVESNGMICPHRN